MAHASLSLSALVAALAAGASLARGVDLYVPSILNGAGTWTNAPIDGKVAYTLGYTICNGGTTASMWSPNAPQHPISTSNLFVVRDGMIRQIGMSWVYNEFFPLQSHCNFCNAAPTGSLGPGCLTSTTAGVTGHQFNLRRRSEVNPWTALFPVPGDTSGDTSHIGQRLQVEAAEIDPAHPWYFAELQLISPDETTMDAKLFNSAYRRVAFAGPQLTMMPTDTTIEDAAIFAWAQVDPSVRVERIDVPDDGSIYVASKAKNIGGGMWRYTYAVQNINSDRAVRSFAVVMGADPDPDNVTFHDVDYHSGEPYDNTDWTILEGNATIFWYSPETFDENPNTNALRWGTMYTFQFESAALPHDSSVTLGLFKPGTPDAVDAPATTPSSVFCPTDINGDGATDFSDLNLLLGAYGVAAPEQATDVDGDGETGFGDLNLLLGGYGQSC